MATTISEIKEWFKLGKNKGASHMVVMCDTFDWEDYPVYVMPDENVKEKAAELSAQSMQKIMEVYNLSKNLDDQLNQHRAFEY